MIDQHRVGDLIVPQQMTPFFLNLPINWVIQARYDEKIYIGHTIFLVGKKRFFIIFHSHNPKKKAVHGAAAGTKNKGLAQHITRQFMQINGPVVFLENEET